MVNVRFLQIHFTDQYYPLAYRGAALAHPQVQVVRRDFVPFFPLEIAKWVAYCTSTNIITPDLDQHIIPWPTTFRIRKALVLLLALFSVSLINNQLTSWTQPQS